MQYLPFALPKGKKISKTLLQVKYILKFVVPVNSNDWLEVKVNPEKYLK